MKHVKLMTILVSAIILCVASQAFAVGEIGDLFNYSGDTLLRKSGPVGIEREEGYVTVTDGTQLAVAWHLPADFRSGSFPVLLVYFPYHYMSTDPTTGEMVPPIMQGTIDFFISNGYAVVFADMRGSGGSYGSRINFEPQLADDGKEIVDWIADQPWCDGNVGMLGASYMGWSTYAVAGRQPRALKCIVPELWEADEYTRAMAYPGGIRQRVGLLGPAWGPTFFDLNMHLPTVPFPIAMPATPLVDEDGDGDLADEIPIMKNGSFLHYSLPDNPPQYADGEPREHVYFRMTLEHLKNPKLIDDLQGFRDGQAVIGSDITFDQLGLDDYPVRISETGIPILHIGGWFDRYVRGTTQWFATLKNTNPSWMVIPPCVHGWAGFITAQDLGPYIDFFGEDMNGTIKALLNMRLAFLDYHLKGVSNGAGNVRPIYIYVMGEGWRAEKEWPLARQSVKSFYFNDGNALTKKKSKEGADDYKADFTHNGSQDGTNASRYDGTLKGVRMRTEDDKQCLTYTTSALKKDTEVTGHPIAHLWVSSTADYGDFFVYLEDVDENGNAYFVTDGQLRAGFANLVPNEDMLPRGSNLDVLPDIPWHGYKKSDYIDGIFAGGNIVELTFDLVPTSWVFKKGHSIRVSIACADYPTSTLHPMLAPNNIPNDPNNIVPTITVHRDKRHPSRIELPLIPRLGKGDKEFDDII